jgi:hypothetical protein
LNRIESEAFAFALSSLELRKGNSSHSTSGGDCVISRAYHRGMNPFLTKMTIRASHYRRAIEMLEVVGLARALDQAQQRSNDVGQQLCECLILLLMYQLLQTLHTMHSRIVLTAMESSKILGHLT